MRKCEKQRHKPACASTQSDQRLYHSQRCLPPLYTQYMHSARTQRKHPCGSLIPDAKRLLNRCPVYPFKGLRL